MKMDMEKIKSKAQAVAAALPFTRQEKTIYGIQIVAILTLFVYPNIVSVGVFALCMTFWRKG